MLHSWTVYSTWVSAPSAIALPTNYLILFLVHAADKVTTPPNNMTFNGSFIVYSNQKIVNCLNDK
jgi:hypothetical protein